MQKSRVDRGLSPKDRETLNSAFATHQNGFVADAAKVYLAVHSANPNDFESAHLLGITQIQLGDFASAIQILRKALRLAPRSAVCHSNLGSALFYAGAYAEALSHFDRAIALEPAFANAHSSRAGVLIKLNRPEHALEAAQKALLHQPQHAESLLNKGSALLSLRRYEEARSTLEASARLAPNNPAVLLAYANALFRLRQFQPAASVVERTISIKPDFAEAHTLRSDIAMAIGNHPEALKSAERALAISGSSPDALCARGASLLKLGRFQEALEAFDQALEARPSFTQALSNRGTTLLRMGRAEAAESAFRAALEQNPNFFEAVLGHGDALAALGRLDEARERAASALDRDPSSPEALGSLGSIELRLGQNERAIELLDKALHFNAQLASAHHNKGLALAKLYRHAAAISSFSAAASADPVIENPLISGAEVLFSVGQVEDALTWIEAAIERNPSSALAFTTKGGFLTLANRHAQAAECFRRARALQAEQPAALGLLIYSQLMIGDWSDLPSLIAECETATIEGKFASPPLPVLSISGQPDVHRRAAENLCRSLFGNAPANFLSPAVYDGDRICIGYFSSDFGDHPVGRLMASVIENHDRSQFRVALFSTTQQEEGDVRTRLIEASDVFVDASGMGDIELAHRARELGVHLAVDLNGHTAGSRPSTFYERCAPVQINYLGYPGTMGLGCYDYIIGDDIVIPPTQVEHYSEEVIRIPGPYIPLSADRPSPNENVDRSSLGLPLEGPVFCCFNNSYKINPDVFDCWAEVMRTCETGVLWFRSNGNEFADNMRKEATKRGIAAERLVFAPRADLAAHMNRQRAASLFLDTWPYNAHATAIDALWAGLPVITLEGSSFPGRVGASLLSALGLTELIAKSKDDYILKACSFASDERRLASLRRKLDDARESSDFYSAIRSTKKLEQAFLSIARRHWDVAGLAVGPSVRS